MSMSKFENLSKECQKIVENYISGSNISNKKDELIVSLYAIQEEADPDVLNILRPYIKDLSDTLSESDIHILNKEFKSIVKYCWSRKESIPDSYLELCILMRLYPTLKRSFGDLMFKHMGYPIDRNKIDRNKESFDIDLTISESRINGKKVTSIGDLNDPQEDLLTDFNKMVANLCSKAKDQRGLEVFLPFSGFAQFATSCPNYKYEGFETDAETWAFSKILLHSYEVEETIKYSSNIYEGLSESKLFDLIFYWTTTKDANEDVVADTLYHLATKSLKENGTMLCFLPTVFCANTSIWFKLRKILKDFGDEYSAMVITLPLRSIEPDLCLFVLHRDNRGEIILVDASRTTKKDCFPEMSDWSFNEVPLNTNVLDKLFINDKKFIWKGTSSDLVGDINLNPLLYILHINSFKVPNVNYQFELLDNVQIVKNVKPLYELVEIVPTVWDERITSETETPEHSSSLSLKDLSSNYLNCVIHRDTIPLGQQKGFVLNENCLLAGFIGGKFKVGKIVDLSASKGIVLHNDVIPFRLKSNEISEDFLLKSIMSDYVIRQAEIMFKCVSGKIMPNIFPELTIAVPSREIQEHMCKEDVRQSLIEAEANRKASFEEFKRDIRMKKHAIGQTIFSLNNWWKSLQRARREGNGIVDDNVILGRIQKICVKDIYNNLQQTIEQLQQQISKFDRGIDSVSQKISLPDFIQDYIDKHKSPLFQYDYVLSNSTYTTRDKKIDDEKKMVAFFPPDALTIIFDNIVNNACRHGFTGRENNEENNIIRIQLDRDGTDLVITISNNGSPVREDVNEEFVFTYNKSTENGNSHYGYGGYEVHYLMRTSDGDAEFISQPHDTFPVAYKLIFHNTDI